MTRRYTIAPRVALVYLRDETPRYEQPLRRAQDVWSLLREEVEVFDREHFLSLLVDGRHKAIGLEEVSVGTVTASLVHPREVFKAAYLANATGLILIHNHPSGDPTPSPEDREITTRLKEAGKLLGVNVLDHVIFGRECFYSFADHGAL